MADLYAKYNCTYCQEEISGLRVRCAECVDFDICLLCFSVGAEIGSHRNDHSYQFMDSGTVGIFQGRGSWSAKEEVRLLDAIEQFGFGNWEDISKHIETRASEEAKDEYISHYLEGSIGRATWGGVEMATVRAAPTPGGDGGPLDPQSVARLPPLSVSQDEAAQLGYMPNRDDFEREHDHEAEQIISSLSLNPDDDDLDIALKLSQVDIYTRRLRERTRRKRLVRDYQLVTTFFNNIKNRGKLVTKIVKEKKDFMDRLRPFTRFASRTEHMSISGALWKERELRVRLSELSRYRRHGLTSVEECAHFERHASAAGGIGGGAGSTGGSSLGGLASVNGRRAPRMAGSSGCTTQAMASQRDLSPTHLPNQRKREGEGGSSSTSPKCTRGASTACGCCKRPTCSNTINSATCCNANAHLLTNNEVQLCNTFNLPPIQYITMKTVLLRSRTSEPHSSIKRETSDGSDSSPEWLVSRYLQANGWVCRPSPAPPVTAPTAPA